MLTSTLALVPSLTPLPLSLLSDRGPFVVCFHSISRPPFVPTRFTPGLCWASCRDYVAGCVLRLEVEFCFWLVLVESCCYFGLGKFFTKDQNWFFWSNQFETNWTNVQNQQGIKYPPQKRNYLNMRCYISPCSKKAKLVFSHYKCLHWFWFHINGGGIWSPADFVHLSTDKEMISL